MPRPAKRAAFYKEKEAPGKGMGYEREASPFCIDASLSLQGRRLFLPEWVSR